MLSLTPKTQIDKAKHALRDSVADADEVVRDERLRAAATASSRPRYGGKRSTEK